MTEDPPAEEPPSVADEEQGLRPRSSRSSNGNTEAPTAVPDEYELHSEHSESSGFVKRKTSQFLEAVTGSSPASEAPLSPKLAALVEAYAAGDVATQLRAEIDALQRRDPAQQQPDVAQEETLLRGRKGASWLTQFRILSGRAFKNLYRDPALLSAHYLSAIALARERLSLYCAV